MPFFYRPDDLMLDAARRLWRVGPDVRPRRLSAAAADRSHPHGPARQTVDWLRLPGGANCRLERINRQGVTSGWLASHRLAAGTAIATAVVGRAPAGQMLAVQAAPPVNDIGAGFFAGTMISTDEGEVPVDWLRPGDRVLTRDSGYVALGWIGRVAAPPSTIPATLIPRGALGRDLPVRPLRLPSSHGVLLASGLFDLHFGASEMLADARDLPESGAAALQDGTPVYQLAFAEHQIILAEGLWVESLMPDRVPQAAGPLIGHDDGGAAPCRIARPRLAAWEVRMFDIAKLLAVERVAA